MLKEAMQIDPERVSGVIKRFISAKVGEAGACGVTLGLSGGIDSALTSLLCADALGKERVHALVMPDRESNEADVEDALSLAGTLGIECRRIDIAPVLETCKSSVGGGDRRSLGNLKARVRMTLLYYKANKENLLVAGTSNKSEFSVGYFTKYGDGAADMAPLGALYKTQVRKLAEHLGLPRHILDKEPSAGLWPGQTDEAELGLSYEVLDIVLLGLEKAMSHDAIAFELGMDVKTIKKVESLFEGSRHKRSLAQIPELG